MANKQKNSAKVLIDITIKGRDMALKFFKDLNKLIKNSNIGSFVSKMKELDTAVKKDSEITKENIKAKKEQNKEIEKTAYELAKEKEVRRVANLFAKATVKMNESLVGSYNRLSAEYTLNKIKLNGMSSEMRKNTTEGRALEKKTADIYSEMNRLQKATGKHTLSVGDYEIATKKLNKTLNYLYNRQSAIAKNQGKSSEAYKKISNQIKYTQKRLDSLTVSQQKNNNATKNGVSQLKMLASTYLGLSAARRVFSSSTTTMIEFEAQMSSLHAISGATDEQFKLLKDDAMRLGEATTATATEVGALQTEYAKLGFTTQEILDATEATILLSEATKEDVATAAEIAGATVRAFGMDASKTKDVVDVMAKSFTSSALNLERFGETMKYVAPIAKAANISLEQTTAAMSAMADAGIHGSMAGTSLKRIFSEVEKSGKPLEQFLGDLGKSNLTLAKASSLVGERAKASLIVLVDNKDKVNDLTTSYENASGAAQAMADIQRDNVAGALKLLGSAWQGFILKMSDGGNIMRSIVDYTRIFVTWLGKNTESIKAITKVVIVATAAWVAYKTTMILSTVATKLHISGLIRLTRMQGITTVATNIATNAVRSFNTALKNNWVGWLVTLLTAAASAYYLFSSSAEKAEKVQNKINDATQKGLKNAKSQTSKLDLLYTASTNVNLSMKDRLLAANELIKQHPDVFKNITAEEIAVGKAAEAYKQLRLRILEVAKTEAYKDAITENQKQIVELESNIDNLNSSIDSTEDSLAKNRKNRAKAMKENVIGSGYASASFTKIADSLNKKIIEYKDNIKSASDEIKEINKANDILASKIKVSSLVETRPAVAVPIKKKKGNGGGDEEESEKSIIRAIKALRKKFANWNKSYQKKTNLEVELEAEEDRKKAALEEIEQLKTDEETKLELKVALQEKSEERIAAIKKKWADKQEAIDKANDKQEAERKASAIQRYYDIINEASIEQKELEDGVSNEKAEAEKAKEDLRLEEQKKRLKDDYDKKYITEKQLNNAVLLLEENSAERKKAIDNAVTDVKMQNASRTFSAFGALATQASAFAEDGRALAYTGAVLDAASAVMGTWAGYAKMGLFGTIQAVAQTAMIGVTLGTQLATINSAGKDKKSKTKKGVQKFETGGIVDGNSYTGDNINILANSKEMILTQSQQKELFEIAKGGGSQIDYEKLSQSIARAINSQRVYIVQDDIKDAARTAELRESEFES